MIKGTDDGHGAAEDHPANDGAVPTAKMATKQVQPLSPNLQSGHQSSLIHVGEKMVKVDCEQPVLQNSAPAGSVELLYGDDTELDKRHDAMSEPTAYVLKREEGSTKTGPQAVMELQADTSQQTGNIGVAQSCEVQQLKPGFVTQHAVEDVPSSEIEASEALKDDEVEVVSEKTGVQLDVVPTADGNEQTTHMGVAQPVVHQLSAEWAVKCAMQEDSSPNKEVQAAVDNADIREGPDKSTAQVASAPKTETTGLTKMIEISEPPEVEQRKPGDGVECAMRAVPSSENRVQSVIEDAEGSENEERRLFGSTGDTSSDETDADEDSDDEEMKHRLEAIRRAGDEMDDEAGGIAVGPRGLVSQNEIAVNDLPVEKMSLKIPSDHLLEYCGCLTSVVEGLAVVSARPIGPGGTWALDADSILCLEDRSPLGKVFETLGPIIRPFYSVRVSELDKAVLERLEPGLDVYFVREMSEMVDPDRLRDRGCDASNVFDEELHGKELEFSDDEAEAASKRKTSKRKTLSQTDRRGGGRARPRGAGRGLQSSALEGNSHEYGQNSSRPRHERRVEGDRERFEHQRRPQAGRSLTIPSGLASHVGTLADEPYDPVAPTHNRNGLYSQAVQQAPSTLQHAGHYQQPPQMYQHTTGIQHGGLQEQRMRQSYPYHVPTPPGLTPEQYQAWILFSAQNSANQGNFYPNITPPPPPPPPPPPF